MYKVKVEIETIVPYKVDRFSEELQEIIRKGKSLKGQTFEDKKEMWERKLYKDKKGCYIPVSHLYHCIKNGLSRPIPLVSNKVKMTQVAIKSTLFFEEDKIYINKPKSDRIEYFWVRTKLCGMQENAHPVFDPPIKAIFTINVVQDYLLPEILKEGIIRGGQCFGIGAGRPQYGRFIVKKFDVI